MKGLGLFFAIGLAGIILLATVLQLKIPINMSNNATAPVSTNELLDGLHEKLQAVNSYRATFQMIFADGMEVVGKITFAWPDQLRMEMEVSGD